MTLVSKNVYTAKLNDLVSKYNNNIIALLKWNPHILTLVKKLIWKILNVKLMILSEYQNIKIFSEKVTLKIGLKKLLW